MNRPVPSHVLMLFRKGMDSLTIARMFHMAEPDVCRLLATAREEERASRRTA